MSQSTGSWIHDLLIDNQDVETPTSWIYWSLMCCISAAAANAYTLSALRGNLLYYPNIYVMLLGESGLGKGYPVNLAKRLVQEAEVTRVIAGRSSIQAIIKDMSTTKTAQGKPIILDSRAFIVNGELSTAIIKDPDSLTVLTDLYDRNYNAQWTNLLKGDGPEKLKEPYVTCLFGSSPAHFYDSVPQANIEGGYVGRNLIVYEEKRSKDLDLLDDLDTILDRDNDRFNKYLLPKYVTHLKKIASESKRLRPDKKAMDKFNSWRREWRAAQIKYNDKTGFVNRVPDHVLKVSMCLALSRYDNSEGIVVEEDINEAISGVTSLIYASQKASESKGIDPLAVQTKKVIDNLLASSNLELTRKELLIRGYGDYDSATLDKITDTLLEMGWIKRSKIGVGKNSDWLIILTGEPREAYLKFKEGNKR